MVNEHQMADKHPWQPGAWVGEDEYDIRDDLTSLTSLTMITDLSDLPTDERCAARLTTAVMTDLIVGFTRLDEHYRRDPQGLRRFLGQRNALFHSRFQQQNLRRKS